MKKIISLLFALATIFPPFAHPTNNPSKEPTLIPPPQDSSSPHMVAHKNKQRNWKFSFSYMHMDMKGSLEGTKKISPSEIFTQGYTLTGIKMVKDAFKFHVMYKATDGISLMASIPYLIISMDHVTNTGALFTLSSKGIGDLMLRSRFTLYKKSNQMISFDAGVTFPTGSINKKDDTPAVSNILLSYPMQTGSGTFNLLPSLMYQGKKGDWFWGINSMGIIRLGRNQKGYAFGNQIKSKPWVGKSVRPGWDVYVGLEALSRGNVKGAAQGLNPAITPQANPNLQGGRKLKMYFGTNLSGEKGILKNQRLKVELYAPIYQNLDGPQLKVKWALDAYWSLVW